MSFIGTIKNLDTIGLLMINGHHSDYFDQFMWLFSDRFVWIAFYISVLAYLIIKNKKNALPVIVGLVICVLLCDQISSSLIKDMVHRLRPTRRVDILPYLHTVNGYLGGKYGFVSSHAANTLGFAVLTSRLFKDKTYTILIYAWAFLTSYSRIYLGVHFPLDVIGGMLVGLSVAVFILWILKKYFPQVFAVFTFEKDKLIPDFFPVAVMSLTLVTLIIYSAF